MSLAATYSVLRLGLTKLNVSLIAQNLTSLLRGCRVHIAVAKSNRTDLASAPLSHLGEFCPNFDGDCYTSKVVFVSIDLAP
jgi:hypothetical protein